MLLWYLITCLVWLIALCSSIIHMTCSWPGCHVCSACVRGLKMTNRMVWSDWEDVSFTWTDRRKRILYFLINNLELCLIGNLLSLRPMKRPRWNLREWNERLLSVKSKIKVFRGNSIQTSATAHRLPNDSEPEWWQEDAVGVFMTAGRWGQGFWKPLWTKVQRYP